jgi:hypothetical protein
MKKFKYASPQDFLSMLQAKTPYDDRHSSQKNQDIIVLLVFHVKKLFRMREAAREMKYTCRRGKIVAVLLSHWGSHCIQQVGRQAVLLRLQ